MRCYWTAAILLCFAGVALAGDCGCRGRGTPRIIDGTNVPASNYPTVGVITDAANTFICTGTLIAPHFVLCAAHCAVDGNTGQLAMGQTEGRFMLGGVTYNSVHVYANPTYKGDNSQEVEGAIDLSIFELDRDVPNVTPSPLNHEAPVVGTVLTLVGYGEQGVGSTGTNHTLPADGTVNFGRTPIDIVTSTFIKWNFDSVPPPNQEANTAPGDSGGPQFVNIDGVLTIASVTSGGRKNNSGFGDLSYNTRVDIALDWINSITGGQPVDGNHNPGILSLNANPNPADPGQEVTFTAAAGDADGDTLNYHWIFGDGSNDGSGAAQTHTYATDGTYTVALIVTDGKGGSVSQTLSMVVGKGVSTPDLLPITVDKQSFKLNFKTAKDTLSMTLFSDAFFFDSKFEFIDMLNGAIVRIYIDDVEIDLFQVSNGKAQGLGRGTLVFNYRQGSVRYQARNFFQLYEVLKPFGVVNDNINKTVTIPVRVKLDNKLYGTNVNFFYTAKLGKAGTGKSR